MYQIIATSAATALIFMVIMFVTAQIKKDNSIVDIGWGIGFILISFVLLFTTNQPDIKDLLLTTMILIWGLRLAIHIYIRARGKGEDFRYAQWRKDWGKNAAVKAFFKVFMLQGIIMIAVAFPIMVVFNGEGDQLNAFSLIGFIIFVFGFLFESIGDYQMYNFKKKAESKGRIITSGLWKYTRHPNYFGEAVLWWGIGIVAIGSDLFLTAFIGPIVINLLLIYVSGVPMLEKKYAGNKQWENYKKVTPAFLPFIGKKG